MVKQYPYLNDISFLNKIYGQHNKTHYVKITILDWHERIIKEIQGQVISASMSVNGDSSVRRTANLSVKILDNDELYKNSDSLFAINKKVFLEVGIKNNFAHLNQYRDYPTIWFPFGVMIIQNGSITHDMNGIVLNLSLGDKMSLLNGDAGGVIPASVNFESIDTLGPDGGLHTEWVRINQLIPELVNHFGGEDLNKILVNDIDNKIKQVLKWRGSSALYLFIDKNDKNNSFYSTIRAPRDLDPDAFTVKTILFNYDAGYTYTDFVYPGELVAAPGDTVCTILDKIKNTLGNHEYFYDVFGNFIFREKENYLNTTPWRQIYQDVLKNPSNCLPYRYNMGLNKSVYKFKDSNFIISYSNSPQFNMIKNDFVVWGIRKDTTGQQLPCRYHLAIDKKPVLLENKTYYNICFDTSVYDGIRRAFFIKGGNQGRYTDLNSLKEDHPLGIVGDYYYVEGTGPNDPTRGVYTWVTDIKDYNTMYLNFVSAGDTNIDSSKKNDSTNTDKTEAGYVKLPLATFYSVFTIPTTTDWRNILYFQGLQASVTGTDTGYYWAELCNEWPKIYDIENDQWYVDSLQMPTSLDWWLDILDTDSVLNQFSVDAIGRRSYAKTDNDCNCVFEPDIPDIVMVNMYHNEEDIDARSQKTIAELKELGLITLQVQDPVYNSLITGGTFNSCYQHVRQLLTEYTDYNENINITCLPIYHLEPNTRISLNDPDSGIQGDYLINSISFDLSERGTMTISAKKCIEKI